MIIFASDAYNKKLFTYLLTYLFSCLRRSATAAQAEENAKLHDGVGYHYPWQSGTSGAEVSPQCPAENPRCHWNRLFVTAGVSYAIRLYYSMTRDYDYMVNTIYAGCEVSREIARFLANQMVYNPEHGRYDMNGTYFSTLNLRSRAYAEHPLQQPATPLHPLSQGLIW